MDVEEKDKNEPSELSFEMKSDDGDTIVADESSSVDPAEASCPSNTEVTADNADIKSPSESPEDVNMELKNLEPCSDPKTPERNFHISTNARSLLKLKTSPHRRIPKAYKRQASLMNSQLGENMKQHFNYRKMTQNCEGELLAKAISLAGKPTTPPTSYPESFTKGMVTVRKIETLLDPKRRESMLETPDKQQLSSKGRTIITFIPGSANSKPITLSKVVFKPNSPEANKAPDQHSNHQFVPKVLKPPAIRRFRPILPNSKPVTLKQSPPPKMLPTASAGSRIRLQKMADGSYGFIKTKIPNKNAYKDSTLIVRKKGSRESSASRPSTKSHLDSSNEETISTPERTQMNSAESPSFSSLDVNEPSTSKATTPPSSARASDIDNEDFVFDKPELQDSNNSEHLSVVELSMKEEAPEPFKYLIPQHMLSAETDKVKVIEESSPLIDPNNYSNQPSDAEMFVIEDEVEEGGKECEASTSINAKSRRKSTLVPKTDSMELQFEDSPFKMPKRPQANIDLIENLSKYRGMIMNLMKKLKMPPMTFTEENSDDYINVYKIYRN